MKSLKAIALASVALLPSAALADWSGFYIGGSIGAVTEGDLTFSGGFENEIEDATPFGVFLGYQQQSGQIVFGAEYAFAIDSDIGFSETEGDDTIAYGEGDLKARVGYDFGNFLAYGVISSSAIAIADSDEDVVASGIGFGFGADYAVNRNFIIGVEYMYRDLEGEYDEDGILSDDDVDVRADSLNLRAAYKF